MTVLYNIVMVGYIAVVVWYLTKPWHDAIGDTLIEATVNARNVWERGRFVMEAKIDTIILTEGM